MKSFKELIKLTKKSTTKVPETFSSILLFTRGSEQSKWLFPQLLEEIFLSSLQGDNFCVLMCWAIEQTAFNFKKSWVCFFCFDFSYLS